jgi:oligopeptide/dipeptide ABC transporter ATP-binding protein
MLLRVQNLQTHFTTEEGLVKAVDGVDLELMTGETLGIVGESGCGKSVTALSIMQLIQRPRGNIVGGKIEYFQNGIGVEITALDPKGVEMRGLRGNAIAMIFQEPMMSLNPVFKVGEQLTEAIILHQRVEKSEARELAIGMLERVGLSSPRQQVDEYPHQLSGGMRQRVMIAMALSCDPKLLIADEPTTALDVTIEAQILELMKALQRDFGMSIMMITHDLGVIGEMCDRVIVMYLGKIVESGTTDDIFYSPMHPYTQGLLKSIPQIGLKRRLNPITGSVPSMSELPEGCSFAPRCPHAMEICRLKEPPEFDVGEQQKAKCWLHQGASNEVVS